MPDAAELVAAGDTLAEASLYNEAISTYTKAIELNPTAPTYYVKRYSQKSSKLMQVDRVPTFWELDICARSHFPLEVAYSRTLRRPSNMPNRDRRRN